MCHIRKYEISLKLGGFYGCNAPLWKGSLESYLISLFPRLKECEDHPELKMSTTMFITNKHLKNNSPVILLPFKRMQCHVKASKMSIPHNFEKSSLQNFDKNHQVELAPTKIHQTYPLIFELITTTYIALSRYNYKK